MPKVYNKYHKDFPEGAVFIGRPTKWGNPYSHLESARWCIHVETRFESIKFYKDWLDGREIIPNNPPPTTQQIKEELRGKNLLCFCAPLLCHGDILLEIANED